MTGLFAVLGLLSLGCAVAFGWALRDGYARGEQDDRCKKCITRLCEERRRERESARQRGELL